jgi:hypothetical protein
MWHAVTISFSNNIVYHEVSHAITHYTLLTWCALMMSLTCGHNEGHKSYPMNFLEYFYPFLHGQVTLLLKNRPRLIYKHELVPYGFIYAFFHASETCSKFSPD